MTKYSQAGCARLTIVVLSCVLVSMVVLPTTVVAQNATENDSRHTNHASGKSTAGDPSLVAQLRDLQITVAKLEAALKQKHVGGTSSGMQGSSTQGMMDQGMGSKVGMGMGSMPGRGTPGMGMPGMGMSGMGMSGMRMSGMGMPGMGMSGMGMMSDKKGMMSGQGMGGQMMSGMAMMGQMKGMSQMQMPSALPGFAGASHIYHIGDTSFFLDHSQHITLTQEQQVKLNQIKEEVILGQATLDRRISQAEQELWVLTSSDAPDAAKLEAKIRQIEKLRSDKRIAYIRAVGEAASVLTDEQRQTLVGHLPPDHNSTGATGSNEPRARREPPGHSPGA